MDFIISLVVILIFVAVSMKKSGQLDEVMKGMKKKNQNEADNVVYEQTEDCLLYTSPSPRDRQKSRMPSSA